MVTAADAVLRVERDERDRRILHAYIEAFWKRWAPDDLRDQAEMQADLHNLMRLACQDAQAPLLKIIEAFSRVATRLPFTVDPTPRSTGGV